MKVGEDFVWLKLGNEIPEGAVLLSYVDVNDDDAPFLYKLLPNSSNVIQKAINLLDYAIGKADIDDNGYWKKHASEFINKYKEKTINTGNTGNKLKESINAHMHVYNSGACRCVEISDFLDKQPSIIFDIATGQYSWRK